MTRTLVIPPWANGPDGSANGGWCAGLLARERGACDSATVVNLRVPPPLGRPLRVLDVDGADDGGVQLVDDDTVVATAAGTAIDTSLPDGVRRVSVEMARAAERGFPYRDSHPFPRCLVCGTERAPDTPSYHLHAGAVDHLHVRNAERADVPVFASCWTPTCDEFRAAGASARTVSVEARWASLDCPSAAPFARPDRTAVLARFAVALSGDVAFDEPHVVCAWAEQIDGRKLSSRSVLLTSDGDVRGVADALWIDVTGR